jgi:hypothetical protein
VDLKECGDGLLRSLRVHGDGAVIFVSNPTEHAELAGAPPRGLAESDSLDSARDAHPDRAGSGRGLAGGAPSVSQDEAKIAHRARLSRA